MSRCLFEGCYTKKQRMFSISQEKSLEAGVLISAKLPCRMSQTGLWAESRQNYISLLCRCIESDSLNGRAPQMSSGSGTDLRISDCQSGVTEGRRGVRNEAAGALRVSSERRAASQSGNPFWDKCSLGKSSEKSARTWTCN